MKKIFGTLLLSVLLLPFLSNSSYAASSTLTFGNFDADYYLEKTATGTRMKVVETIEADFPTGNVNHGITRSIPRRNQDGKNITVPSEKSLDLSVKMDGTPVQFKSELESDTVEVKIGSASTYVHGPHTYELTYYFDNVISNVNTSGVNTFDSDNISYQDLYWDINGTGWSYSFDKVTARVHLTDEMVKALHNTTSNAKSSSFWCYTGRYGSSASDCMYYQDQNVVTFIAFNIKSGHNLTIDINFKPNTFLVPAPEKSYIILYIGIIEAIIIFLIIYFAIIKNRQKYSEKISFFNGIPTPPQYEPKKGYHVAELGSVYTKSTKDSKVATLLELIVSKKVSLVKEGKRKWKVKVENLKGVTDAQIDLLKIVRGSDTQPAVGDEYLMKHHSYSSSLDRVFTKYTTDITNSLVESGDYEKDTAKTSSLAEIGIAVAIVIALCLAPSAIAVAASTLLVYISETGKILTFTELIPIEIIAFIATMVAWAVASSKFAIYKKRTIKGLELSNYVDGLKLYIKMAESDRLSFLQSVSGADTTPEGIVKLYEKLLPYAALFGLEKSWMKELQNYCEEVNVNAPDWYTAGFNYAALSSVSRSMASTVSRPASPSSSSGGGGGGGGGFSGGGGGGGGGGGW